MLVNQETTISYGLMQVRKFITILNPEGIKQFWAEKTTYLVIFKVSTVSSSINHSMLIGQHAIKKNQMIKIRISSPTKMNLLRVKLSVA